MFQQIMKETPDKRQKHITRKTNLKREKVILFGLGNIVTLSCCHSATILRDVQDSLETGGWPVYSLGSTPYCALKHFAK